MHGARTADKRIVESATAAPAGHSRLQVILDRFCMMTPLQVIATEKAYHLTNLMRGECQIGLAILIEIAAAGDDAGRDDTEQAMPAGECVDLWQLVDIGRQDGGLDPQNQVRMGLAQRHQSGKRGLHLFKRTGVAADPVMSVVNGIHGAGQYQLDARAVKRSQDRLCGLKHLLGENGVGGNGDGFQAWQVGTPKRADGFKQAGQICFEKRPPPPVISSSTSDLKDGSVKRSAQADMGRSST